jgi:putative ABC transport system permease protein
MRNLLRNPGRSISMGAAMATLAGSLLIVAGALQTVGSSTGRGAERLGPEIVVDARATADNEDPMTNADAVPPAAYLDYTVVEKLRAVEVIVPQYGGKAPIKLPGVAKASARLSLHWWGEPREGGAPLRVVGFEPATDFSILPWLEKPMDQPLGAAEALAGYFLAHSIGETVDLGEARLRVVGRLARTWNDELDRSMFVHLPIAWSLLRQVHAGAPDSGPIPVVRPITSVIVRPPSTVDPVRAANFIRSTIPGTDVRVLDQALASLGTELRIGVDNLTVIAAVIWLTGFLLAGTVFSMIVRERRRELGLLRAMGATKSRIVGLLTLELVTVCAVGGALGVVAVLVATTTMPDSVGRYFGSLWPDPVEVLALGLVCVLAVSLTGVLSALVPALRAVSLEPHIAIRDAP